MNRILYHGNQYGLQLASIDGGSLSNAIPRESFAYGAIPVGRVGEFLNSVTILIEKIKNELSGVEPSLRIDVMAAELPESVIEQNSFVKVLNAIYACPNGVIRMSNEMDGLVETSNNLALVKSGNGVITIECLLRSSADSARDDLEIMIQSLFDLAGADSVFDGAYPGWKPNQGYLILKIMQALYTTQFGNVPQITAIHAGLECGILGGACPELDMISFGPTIRYPHSPDEKVNIPSVQKFWEFLVETLRNIPLLHATMFC